MENNTINGYTMLYKLERKENVLVWYGENSIGKPAIIKEYAPFRPNWDRLLNRYKDIAKLNHPNIGKFYDFEFIGWEFDNRTLYTIEEYLEGDYLNNLIRHGVSFAPNQICTWWNQLVSALNYIHQQGILHCNIIPSSICITKGGDAVLTDFGIEYYMLPSDPESPCSSLDNPYSSPEQVTGSKHIDYRSDVYSLAVIFAHLLSDKAPYPSDLSVYSLQKSIVEEPLDLSGIPLEWRNFLRPYLAKKPEDRPLLEEFDIKNIHCGNEGESSFAEEKSDDVELMSVLYKLITGKNDWSLSELQFQNNNVELIESKLNSIRHCDYNYVYVSSAGMSMAERSMIYKSSPHIKRVISKPEAVVLGMFYATKDECTVAIIVVDNCCIDLGVYLVGDGVFEEICSLGVSAIENFSERLDQLPIVPSDIDKLIILSNKEIPQYEVKQIEESLNLKSEIRYNLDELMTFGSFIYRGVLCGWVRDILLLPVLPNSLYCETLQNEVFELIGANITIPTRKRVKVVTKSPQLYIKEKNHNHPIAILQLDNMFGAKKCDSLDFETDIDANFKIKITITGADKENKYEVFI